MGIVVGSRSIPKLVVTILKKCGSNCGAPRNRRWVRAQSWPLHPPPTPPEQDTQHGFHHRRAPACARARVPQRSKKNQTKRYDTRPHRHYQKLSQESSSLKIGKVDVCACATMAIQLPNRWWLCGSTCIGRGIDVRTLNISIYYALRKDAFSYFRSICA